MHQYTNQHYPKVTVSGRAGCWLLLMKSQDDPRQTFTAKLGKTWGTGALTKRAGLSRKRPRAAWDFSTTGTSRDGGAGHLSLAVDPWLEAGATLFLAKARQTCFFVW